MRAMSYEFRPSKSVARKVFVDVLRRLALLSPLDGYHYIGFGALEFLDFDLVHRRLGVTRMTSIEANSNSIERYVWNRPFNGIAVLPGRAADVLPTLDWSDLAIVWLDYTSTLTVEVLSDAALVARVLQPGSVLAVTVNAHPGRLGERREALEAAVGPERVPLGVNDNRLGDWGLAETQNEILAATITDAIATRPGRASWRQVLNVQYKDNARMQMLAGVVGAPALERALDQCRFADVPAVRLATDPPLVLQVPLLTGREQAHLNTQLPRGETDSPLQMPGVPQADLDEYGQIYRWLDPAAG